MTDVSRARPAAIRPFDLAVWWLVVLASSLLLTLWHVAATQPYVSLERLAQFSERAPFQHRVLMPVVVAAAMRITGWPAPALFRAAEVGVWILLIAVARLLVADLRPRPGWWAIRLLALTVALSVSAELTLPARVRAFSGDTPGSYLPVGDVNAAFGSATRIVALPNLYYPWDLPAAVGLLALVACLYRLRERASALGLTLYGLTFVVACLNRETPVLVIPLSLWAVVRQWPRGRLVSFGLVQLGVWALVIAAIEHTVEAPPNTLSTLPGGSYEWYLWTNLRSLTYPPYALTTIVPLAAGAWLPVAIYWRAAPARARALILAYVVPSLAAALTFGVLHETRIFTEASAAIWLAAVLTVHSYATGSNPEDER
jgi:hypothetical protein